MSYAKKKIHDQNEGQMQEKGVHTPFRLYFGLLLIVIGSLIAFVTLISV